MNFHAPWFVHPALAVFTSLLNALLIASFAALAPTMGWANTLSNNSTTIGTLERVEDWRAVLPTIEKPGELARVQVRNSRLALDDSVQLHVETLHGTLAPVQQNTPVALENLAAFKVTVEHASLRISQGVLQTLVQAELQATNAPLRISEVDIQPNGIKIAGAIRRLGLWIPFSMDGMPTVANASEIALTPTQLKVAGIPVYKALLVGNVQLQSLIDMKSKAVALQGQAMVLRPGEVLQAPRIAFALNALQLGQGEVNVVLGKSAQPPRFFCNTQCPTNFVYTTGGELRAAGMVLAGQPALITGIGSGALPIPLNNLKGLITTSTVQLRPDGALWISAQEGPLNAADLALLDSGEKTIALLENLIRGENKFADEPSLVQPTAQPTAQSNNQQAVTLAVHQATLLSKEGIEIRIEKLLATTNSTDLGQLPTAAQTVHAGEIALSETALNALMNNALFGFEGSPIRRVKSTLGEGKPSESKQGTANLELELQVKPEILGIPLMWLPAMLGGELKVSSDQEHLELTPEQVHLYGLPVLPLLDFAGIQLGSLLKIDQAAVRLQGNTIRIALNNALPPLQLNTRLRSIKPVLRATDRPYLLVHVGTQPAEKIKRIDNGLKQLPVGLWMNTPEFTALGMRTGPTLGHVYSTPRNERLVIDLAQYPDLLANATLRLPKPERVWVSMPGK